MNDPIDGDDFVSLAQPRSTPGPFAQLREQMVVSIAKQIDRAILTALERRGLTLDEARPRLTRQVMGGLERTLLDGRMMVETGPVRFYWSDDGLRGTVTVQTKEAHL